jgi:predicted RNA-binding Zn ribbon-like protein
MKPDIVVSMVTIAEPVPRTPWQDAHFIGGHPVLDLTNTVFHRSNPVQDNELLKSPADVLSWCRSVGLFKTAPPMADAAGRKLVANVQEVREQAWSVFSAVSRGEAVPTEAFGSLLERAGTGVRARHLSRIDATFEDWVADWKAAGAIPTALAMLAVHGLFTLPPDRIRACGRCGWLFLDSSRGGRRRWCSMTTCGNREKASRHRRGEPVAG